MLISAVPAYCTSSPAVEHASFRSLSISSFSTRGRPNSVSFSAHHPKKLCTVLLSTVNAERWSIRGKFACCSGGTVSELDDNVRRLLRALLWIAEGVYILWLFLLPYAPGDPVWAISSETINSLIGLSLNFFFILPLCNSVGIHLIEAPVLHPVSEGLFNFVVAWTFLFGPLLYTDKWKYKFKGSLDVLWACQLFLTNTVLIPYMAIRLNETNGGNTPRETSKLGSIMTKNAPVVGLIGGLVCFVAIGWAIYGRGDGDFGDVQERWDFLLSYVQSERLAYAFIWDICLYLIFQPWLIGDNLDSIQKDKVAVVNVLRFVPVAGILAYCWFSLNADHEI